MHTHDSRRRLRVPVSPEIAATAREETSVLAAKIRLAESLKAAADAQVAVAQAQCAAAMRSIFRFLELEEGAAAIVGAEGYGERAVLLVDVPGVPARTEVNDV